MTAVDPVEILDHREIASRPVTRDLYHAARRAIDDLCHALDDVRMSQDEWIEMVASFARTNVYADSHCPQCTEDDQSFDMAFPCHIVEERPGWYRCSYVCHVHGRTWRTGYAADIWKWI